MEQESNISRDHIALEAMKVIMKETTKDMLTPLNRLKRWLGLSYESWLSRLEDEELAQEAYDIADAMVAERLRRKGGAS